MERAQTRLLLGLAALVALVAALLWWQGERTEPADPDATELVWELDADRVTAVRVEREEGTLSLEQQDGAWQVVEPFRARADDDLARDLVDAVRDLKSGVPVEAAPERAADFGLGEPPHARVTVTLEGGATKTLDVGVEAPIGFRTYVRAADGAIVAANGDPNRLLQADAGRFRDHRPFRFEGGEVRRVTVASPEGTLSVRGQGHDWWFEGTPAGGAPMTGRADPDRVDDLVTGLLDLRFEHVDDPPAAIESPRFEVTVELADGATQRLEVGDETELGARVEASDGRTGTMASGPLQQLGRGPTDVALPFAFWVRPDVTERVRIEGLATLDARREGPDWLAEGRDPGVVADVIEGLSRVSAVRHREPAPAPAPVEGRVIVSEAGREWTIELGPVIEGYRSARDTAGGDPFRIPQAALEAALEPLR